MRQRTHIFFSVGLVITELRPFVDCCIVNNLKVDPLEIQYPKFDNSRLGFVESVHER